MRDDIDMLRRHERALAKEHEDARLSCAAWRNGLWPHRLLERRFEALTWALDRCRAEIAKAEKDARIAAAKCPTCRGNGSVFNPYSSLSDEMTCDDCKGTGKKP